MSKSLRVVLILLGVVLLVVESRYSGPSAQWVHSHGANLCVSFALYFLVGVIPLRFLSNKFGNTLCALALVFGQEIAQKLDLYEGVFDPWDFAYDAVGVLVALVMDVLIVKSHKHR